MIIGFDAKRAFFNRSGLGNYSRDVIRSLSESFSEHDYYLYSPKPKKSIPFCEQTNCSIKGPETLLGRIVHPWWRSARLGNQIKKDGVNIYHGLSNELPAGLARTQVKSVVTIHDLIFLRYPEFYKPLDRFYYKRKFRFAAENADAVVAVSQQTKRDLIDYLKIPESKIRVIYQTCNRMFYTPVHEKQKESVSKRYNLPKEFILFVGTIEERKNLLTLVKAIHRSKINMHLVVVGEETPYAFSVHEHIRKNKIENIWFLKKVPTQDLPALFQMASVFVYPSLFEGFGLPILEALYSKVPVITSKGSCFAEAGGPSTLYVDPHSPDEIAEAVIKALVDTEYRKKMIEDGYHHALQFNSSKAAIELMTLYKELG